MAADCEAVAPVGPRVDLDFGSIILEFPLVGSTDTNEGVEVIAVHGGLVPWGGRTLFFFGLGELCGFLHLFFVLAHLNHSRFGRRRRGGRRRRRRRRFFHIEKDPEFLPLPAKGIHYRVIQNFFFPLLEADVFGTGLDRLFNPCDDRLIIFTGIQVEAHGFMDCGTQEFHCGLDDHIHTFFKLQVFFEGGIHCPVSDPIGGLLRDWGKPLPILC
jgi:hypothetical protein